MIHGELYAIAQSVVSSQSQITCGKAKAKEKKGIRIFLLTTWSKFMYLGRSFNSSSKIGSLAAKVLVNQIAFAPVFAVYFFGMQSLLAGGSLVDYWERIKNTVPTSFIKSCKLWPAVTAFNFTFIPAQSRPLFAGQ